MAVFSGYGWNGDSVREIILSNGDVAQVSDEDYDYLIKYSWSINSSNYACTTIKDSSVYMHDLIMQRKGLTGICDHKDRNRLNNQRDNIRSVTWSQSNANRCKQCKWLAYINVNKHKLRLGYFDCKIKAAKHRDHIAEKYFGEFAVLNFPKETALD